MATKQRATCVGGVFLKGRQRFGTIQELTTELEQLTSSYAGPYFPYTKFSQLHPMLLPNCEPFQWYFVVTCPACKTRQAIFPDPSNGRARIRRTYEHQCDKCQSVSFYEPEDIERYQHIVERRREPRT